MPTPILKPIKQDRKKNIVLSAEKLFAQFGYYAVLNRNIADVAGVPLRLTGYYFGKKEHLFEAIFERWAQY
ncbi:TetR family transcriptional regulator [Glaciimonas sp. CA11.2]|nr:MULTISPECIES: TetR family transcriptional regulator [unclassified Glaciimonas]MDY7547613.1 TetR family transcriptional regulator [Glaciimonas sp. CA11.2]MEB0084339.1 TetR family transcriptional regulator [Glaciimonas sp. Gout2]MEB0164038.1 TetR family transcriptional regulator [Glaciimonas sp. CA11.2]